jgi:hypothetical protein
MAIPREQEEGQGTNSNDKFRAISKTKKTTRIAIVLVVVVGAILIAIL